MFAKGYQLAQAKLESATASTIYTASMRTEINHIVVTNVSGADDAFRLFHSEDASGYSAGNSLYWDQLVSANTSFEQSWEIGAGIQVSNSGRIGFQPSSNAAFTISLYGGTEQLAERK